MKLITVLLCDDHAIVRAGLRQLLKAHDDLLVVGEADNGHHAVLETLLLQPDVVVMDIAMPLLNGREAMRQIKRAVPGAKLLVLSGYDDERHVQAAIRAGAVGYVTKTAAGKDLFHAIREVHAGREYFSPAVTAVRRQERELLAAGVASPAIKSFTMRQMEILQLIAEGFCNREVADFLVVGIKSVEKHRQIIMDRLNLHNIASLTRYAIEQGVVEVQMTPD